MTAPEISTQDVKAAMSEDSRTSLAPLKEDRGTEKKESKGGKGIFGKKQTKETPKHKTTASPAVGEIVFKNVLADSPVHDDPLSQRSETALSQPITAGHHSTDDPDAISTTADGTDTKSKSSTSDVIVLEPLSLSQASGKHSGVSLSQSDTFAGTEEHYSTQSSAEIAISNVLLDAQHSGDNTSAVWDNREAVKEEGEEDENEDSNYNRLSSYLQGSARLYKDYGSKQHRLNLERVREFLESSGEQEPVDLSVLQDWDGWMIASREIM